MQPSTVRSEILNPFKLRTGKTAPESAGSRYLIACQAVAVGPVSASPSDGEILDPEIATQSVSLYHLPPTMQVTIKSGLSITAPKLTAKA
jgi:hypothetical protein